MLLRALAARDLSVRDVAHQHVLERVLGLALDRAATRPLDELLLPQNVQLVLRRAERAKPKDLADHGRVLEQRLLPRGKRIEARSDDPLHRFREGTLATLAEHAHELLRVQRIAAAALDQVALHFRAER